MFVYKWTILLLLACSGHSASKTKRDNKWPEEVWESKKESLVHIEWGWVTFICLFLLWHNPNLPRYFVLRLLSRCLFSHIVWLTGSVYVFLMTVKNSGIYSKGRKGQVNHWATYTTGVPSSRLEEKWRIISWKRHALFDAVLSYARNR